MVPSLARVYSQRVPAPATPFILAAAVGIVAGLSAVTLTEAIELLHDLFFDRIGDALQDLGGSWMILWVPVLAALPVAFLVHRVASEARGHGVPEVMYAVEARGGRIRPRVPFVKAAASALTIGAGGSVGRSGPIISIGAALASTIAQWTRQSPEMMSLLVAAGAAGGVAATFNAPIAGVFFALEVILRRFNVRNFTIVVTSAVLANMVAIGFQGDNPGIELPPHALESAVEVPLYIGLGIAAAFVGVFFLRVLYLLEDVFEAMPVSSYLRVALGLAVVGALGFWHDEIFGVGFEVIESAAVGEIATGTLALLVVIKLFATSFTIGGGASGGVFAPSLFMGTMLGSLMGVGYNELLGDIAPPGAYGVVGMAAVFAAAARAPITALFIVFEMTRDYSLILPLMIGVATATVLAQLITRDTIYSVKLRRLGVDFTEERGRFAMEEVPVAEVMRTEMPRVRADERLDALASTLGQSRDNIAAIVDGTGAFRGLVSASDLTAALEREDPTLTAGDLEIGRPLTVSPDDSLREVVALLAEHNLHQLPVVARWDEQRLLGIVDQSDVLRAFSRISAGRPAGAPDRRQPIRRRIGASVLEAGVTPNSAFADRRLDQVAVPVGALVTELRRGGVVLVPRGDTVVRPGDQLSILVEPQAMVAVRALFALQGSPEPPAGPAASGERAD